MKKITIIDSYDYVVELIENIVYILNTELYLFTDEKATNDEVANTLVKFISLQIIKEKEKTIKTTANDLMVKRKDSISKRKLAIQIDSDILDITNKAISVILSEGYKKIPSRTMFFRESLRVFYDIFYAEPSTEKKLKFMLLDNHFQELFTTKIVGDAKKQSFTQIINYILLNNFAIDDIIKIGEELIRKIKSGVVLSPFNIKEIFFNKITSNTKNKFWKEYTFINSDGIIKVEGPIDLNRNIGVLIEISMRKLDDLLEKIDVEYKDMDNKIKIFLLMIFINKSLLKISLKIRLLTGGMSAYNLKNAIDLSELLIQPYEYPAIDEMVKHFIPENKNEEKKISEMPHKLRNIVKEINKAKISYYILHADEKINFFLYKPHLTHLQTGLIFYDTFLINLLSNQIRALFGEDILNGVIYADPTDILFKDNLRKTAFLNEKHH